MAMNVLKELGSFSDQQRCALERDRKEAEAWLSVNNP